MAYLLALSLILSLGTVNIGRLSAAETADGGEAESVYAGGNGTAESPYLVSRRRRFVRLPKQPATKAFTISLQTIFT